MSGAEGFFGLAPETNKNNKTTQDEFLVIHHVVKQNIWNMCLIHILCRAQNMLQVAETARLWITSQQLNEHMTERNKIKIPASHNSAFLTQITPFKICIEWDSLGNKKCNSSKLQGSAKTNAHLLFNEVKDSYQSAFTIINGTSSISAEPIMTELGNLVCQNTKTLPFCFLQKIKDRKLKRFKIDCYSQ